MLKALEEFRIRSDKWTPERKTKAEETVRVFDTLLPEPNDNKEEDDMSSVVVNHSDELEERENVVDTVQGWAHDQAVDTMNFLEKLDVDEDTKKPIQMLIAMRASYNFLLIFDPESAELEKLGSMITTLAALVRVADDAYHQEKE